MQRDGSAASSRKVASLLAMSMIGQLSMSIPPTCVPTSTLTSSLVLGGGPLLGVWRGGLTTYPYGPDHAPASHGRRLEKAEGLTTSDTSGPNGSASSLQSDPLSSWESRLQLLLPAGGLTKWPATWKTKVTPGGRRLCQLVPSGRLTAGTGYGLWPTPAARDYRAPNALEGKSRTRRPPTSGRQLPNEIVVHLGGITDSQSGAMGSVGWLNPEFACWLMGFPSGWES